jgi:ABC-2 type transport system permease protein
VRGLWPVARREYVERVRTKAFIIGTILGPVFTAAMFAVPVLTATRMGKPLRLAVLDASGQLAGTLESELGGRRREGGGPQFLLEPAGEGALAAREGRLKEAVLQGRLDGYLHIPADVMQTSKASYYGKAVSNTGAPSATPAPSARSRTWWRAW